MEEKDIDQKAIRTYESDVADAIQHRHTSQASMVVADEEKKHEQERQEGIVVANTEKKPENRNGWMRNVLMILLSMVLLAAGVAAVYYFYTISPLSVRQPATSPATSSPVIISSIVTPDLQKVGDVTGQTPTGIISQIGKLSAANTLAGGGILQIVLGEQASTTQNGNTPVLTELTGPQFISMMGLTPPEALTSSLTDQWMLGTYWSATGESTSTPAFFVIFTTDFFQNAFAGMLNWEATMAPDLSALFGIQPAQWAGGSFHDKLIENKNVREFTDNGSVLFLYSFIDDKTLVIAQSEAALAEIITRFESQAHVR